MTMTSGRVLPLILVASALAIADAKAQTLPLPGQAPADPQQQCVTEFTELRANVEQLGASARAAGERRASREELCKSVEAVADAEAKWVKFTVDNTARCGIPRDLLNKLREVHDHTLVARKKICSAGPGDPAGPRVPSLKDEIGPNRWKEKMRF